MKKNFLLTIYISVLFTFAFPQISSGVDDVDKLDRKFAKHLFDVYITEARASGREPLEDLELLSKMIGYALAQQLKYIHKDTEEHRLWLELEKRVTEGFRGLALAKSVKPFFQFKWK